MTAATERRRRTATGRRGRPAALSPKTWSELSTRHDLLTRATAMAYRSLIALVPLTLLGFALLHQLGEERLWRHQVGPAIRPRLLPDVYTGMDATVERIFSASGLGFLVFALALALWDVSSAIRVLMGACGRIYEQEERRSTVRRLGLSLAAAVPFSGALVSSVLVVMLLPKAGSGALGFVLTVVSWLLALLLLAAALWIVLRVAPPEARPMRWVSAGAGLVVVGWVVQSVLFRWFIAWFANFRSPAGVLAAFLVLTTYLYVASIVFLVGIELDELLREQDAPRAVWDVFRRAEAE